MDMCEAIQACLAGNVFYEEPTSEDLPPLDLDKTITTAVTGTAAGAVSGLVIGTATTLGIGTPLTVATGAGLGFVGGLIGGAVLDIGEYAIPRIMSDGNSINYAALNLYDLAIHDLPELTLPPKVDDEERWRVYQMWLTSGVLLEDAMKPFQSIWNNPELSNTLATSPFLYPQMLTSEQEVGEGSLLDIVSDDPMLIDDFAQSPTFTALLGDLLASEEFCIVLVEQIFSVATAEDSVIAESINSLVDQRMSNYGFQAPVFFSQKTTKCSNIWSPTELSFNIK